MSQRRWELLLSPTGVGQRACEMGLAARGGSGSSPLARTGGRRVLGSRRGGGRGFSEKAWVEKPLSGGLAGGREGSKGRGVGGPPG